MEQKMETVDGAETVEKLPREEGGKMWHFERKHAVAKRYEGTKVGAAKHNAALSGPRPGA